MKTKKTSKLVFTMLFLLFSISSAFATDYYVDAVNGNNSNDGLQSTSAKQTIQAAADLTNPGDTVFVMNGTYGYTTYNNQTLLNITRSGTEGNYITYKPMPGHSPKIKHSVAVTSQVWNAVVVDASYIIVEGFEIEGNNADLNLAEGHQLWLDYENKDVSPKDWLKMSKYNANGISLGKNVQAHHVVIRNCKIHDCAAGVGGGKVDYITIENNIVYNNSWYTMYATSGISILDPKSIDAVTGYKIYIRNNVVYNNKCLVPWEKTNALSDGNGIILDENKGNGTTILPYVGRYLVENNVSYNNGGGGIHAYRCAHVDIINNTAYNNGTNMGYPEIDGQQSTDIKIYNNIMYGRGAGANLNGNDAGAIYDYNIYFNGTSYKNGPNDRTADPKFVNRALDATANFQLLNTSPAINNGNNISGLFASNDILAVSRPVGFSSDMGAYEYGNVIPRAEMNIKQGTTDITDNSGIFDFGSVSSTAPKDITFTIQNIGDAALNLTGTPKVVVAGTGFSILTDAPAVVAANRSVTFTVKLTPVGAAANYTGTVSIISNDADENPYNFAIKGYGYDGTKALQTITFPAIPTKIIGDADFNPGATSDSGLTITYTSSNAAVATIVSGQIRIIGAGTSNIVASQPGDNANNPANSVTQVLTVTPVIPPVGTNLIANPTFDTNTTGWGFSNKNGATTTLENVTASGYTSNVAKITVTNIGTTSGVDNAQFTYNRVFIEKGKTYIVSFTASADATRTINTVFIISGSPYTQWALKSSVPLTTSPTNLGPYNFISTFTGYVDLRFHLGGTGSLNAPVYIDNVSVVEDGIVLGVNEIEVVKSQAEVYAYPNPVADLLNIDFDSKTGKKVTISVIDLQGQVLITKNQLAVYGKNTIELNVGSLANGLYLVKTTENNTNYNTVKVVVKH